MVRGGINEVICSRNLLGISTHGGTKEQLATLPCAKKEVIVLAIVFVLEPLAYEGATQGSGTGMKDGHYGVNRNFGYEIVTILVAVTTFSQLLHVVVPADFHV